MTYALVDEHGIVQNIIIYDGETPYDPAPYELREHRAGVEIGELYPVENVDE